MPRKTSKTSKDSGILKLMKQDHDQVKQLFRQFDRTIEKDQSEAKSIADKIISELQLHTQLEEQIVYPHLKAQDEKLFHEAEEEHHVAEFLMKELEKMDSNDPAFPAKVMVLRENVEHHIKEEEAEMFDRISQLPQDRLEELAEKWQEQKEKAMSKR